MPKQKTPLTKEQIAALSPGSIAKHIVNKFIKKETVNWIRDMAVAKRLVQQFPNPLFWDALPEAQFDAAAQLLTPNSINWLSKRYAQFCLEFPSPLAYNLEKEKVGEDVPIENKKQILMDFLKD